MERSTTQTSGKAQRATITRPLTHSDRESILRAMRQLEKVGKITLNCDSAGRIVSGALNCEPVSVASKPKTVRVRTIQTQPESPKVVSVAPEPTRGMKLEDAERLALSMMEDHGLIGVMDDYGLEDWSFEFDNARYRLGGCHKQEHKITLSRAMVELNDEEVIRDIMLHEIAHAILERCIDTLIAEWGDGIGGSTERGIRSQFKPHGSEWKEIAEPIGANPRNTCAHPDLVVPVSVAPEPEDDATLSNPLPVGTRVKWDHCVPDKSEASQQRSAPQVPKPRTGTVVSVRTLTNGITLARVQPDRKRSLCIEERVESLTVIEAHP